MRAIGIRVASNEVFYAIFEGDTSKPSLLFHSKLSIPKSFKDGQALSWIRESMINIIAEYKVKAVFVRTMEMKSQSSKKSIMDRSRIEGVLLEMGCASGATTKEGATSTITSLISVQSMKSSKGYMEMDEFREVDEWASLNDKYKDACLAGVAALALLAEDNQ